MIFSYILLLVAVKRRIVYELHAFECHDALSFYPFCMHSLRLLPRPDLEAFHLAEEVHHASEDDQQDTTTRAQSEHLGNETLVQSTETLLPHDSAQRGESPVVLGGHAGDLGGVLDSALDDIHWGVKNGTDGATNGTRDQVIADLDGLVVVGVRGKHGADLENAAKVTAVPENMAPHGRLETLVNAEDSIRADDLADNVERTRILGGLRLVCRNVSLQQVPIGSASGTYPEV